MLCEQCLVHFVSGYSVQIWYKMSENRVKYVKKPQNFSPPAGASGSACGGQKFSPEVVLTTPTLLSALKIVGLGISSLLSLDYQFLLRVVYTSSYPDAGAYLISPSPLYWLMIRTSSGTRTARCTLLKYQGSGHPRIPAARLRL